MRQVKTCDCQIEEDRDNCLVHKQAYWNCLIQAKAYEIYEILYSHEVDKKEFDELKCVEKLTLSRLAKAVVYSNLSFAYNELGNVPMDSGTSYRIARMEWLKRLKSKICNTTETL